MMRELLILRQNHIYRFCMVLFPLLVMFFFTSLMDDGLPTSMPVGIVDLDNTSTSRSLSQRLDGFAGCSHAGITRHDLRHLEPIEPAYQCSCS